MTAWVTSLILLLLLTVLILVIILLLNNDESEWAFLTGVVAFGVAIFFMLHLACLVESSEKYREFEATRNAIQSTLDEARASNRELEAASVLRTVAEFNIELAKLKSQKSTFWFGQYVDDRINTLEPIK